MSVAARVRDDQPLAELLGNGTRAITVAMSRDPNAKLTMLLFPSGCREPTLAVKVPTTADAASAVEREAAAISRIRCRLDSSMRTEIPAVVAMVPARTGRALVTTALPGTPMITQYHRWRHVSHRRSVVADFRAAGDWLTRLQTATASRRRPMARLTDAAPAIAARFPDEPALDRVIAALGLVDGRLQAETAPGTVVHGDYWPGNVLLRDGAVVGVIDWEAGEVDGQPLRDITRFALAYALYLDRHTRARREVVGHPGLRAGRWGDGVVYAIDGDGWFPRFVTQWARAQLERLGVSPERWRDVALAGLVEIAVAADDPEFARAHFQLVARLLGAET